MSEAATGQARVLDVGQCNPDHYAIRTMITTQFQAQVDRASTLSQALDAVRSQRYDLVLVNRIIFDDNSDGLELIRQAKREEQAVPIMLISNYPAAQSEAVAAGGVPGFGKADLHGTQAYEHLARFLPVLTPRA